MANIKPYYVIIKFAQGPKIGQYRAWKDFDMDYVWDSPLYEVLGYTDSFENAQKVIKVFNLLRQEGRNK